MWRWFLFWRLLRWWFGFNVSLTGIAVRGMWLVLRFLNIQLAVDSNVIFCRNYNQPRLMQLFLIKHACAELHAGPISVGALIKTTEPAATEPSMSSQPLLKHLLLLYLR